MLEQLLEMMKGLEQNDEFFEVMARVMKKQHSALVKAGFTEEQATEIVAGQGLGIRAS